jgi:AcrR family transcriptional regulator
VADVKRESKPGQRGRISRNQVVAAAAEIVDGNGAEALTIRRLAEACGLSPMGVYRYIRDRDELLELVVEHILEELPRRAPTGAWKEKAAQLFGGFRGMALQHPGVSALGVSRATPVPAMARFTDQALAIMEEAGFRGDEAVLAYDALLMFTIGSILWQFPRTGTERSRLLQAAALDDPPATYLIRHAEALGKRDPDQYFNYGLRALLTGLETVRNMKPSKSSARTRAS